MQPETARLLCRGCTTDCPNYAHCDGTPWRLSDQSPGSLVRAGPKDEGSSDKNAGESLAV